MRWHFLPPGKQPAIRPRNTESSAHCRESRGDDGLNWCFLLSIHHLFMSGVASVQEVFKGFTPVQMPACFPSCEAESGSSCFSCPLRGRSLTELQLFFSSGATSDADLPYKAKECQRWGGGDRECIKKALLPSHLRMHTFTLHIFELTTTCAHTHSCRHTWKY